jgi:hypothetical protein
MYEYTLIGTFLDTANFDYRLSYAEQGKKNFRFSFSVSTIFYLYVDIYIYFYIYIHISISVYIYLYLYINIHIYTHICCHFKQKKQQPRRFSFTNENIYFENYYDEQRKL